MPVTTRLLQRLRETLGDEATNDLFAWFEAAGWVNRAAVREIADLYFERFETRLEQGLAQVRTEFHAELRQEVARLEQGLAAVRAEVRADLATQRADLLKWMFIFWAGTVVPLAGLILTVSRP